MGSRHRDGLKVFMVMSAIGAASLALSSCSPTGLAVGAGASVATASQSEKGLRSAAADLRIRTEINHYLFQKDVDLFSAVSLAVENGRVLMTGAVDKPGDRIEATKLAWKATGVREVINEIQVRDAASLTDRAKDLLINKRLQGQLLLDKDIRSINYSTDTVNGTVYLFGVARDQDELNRVVSHARNINYVANVVSYVLLADAE